MYINKDSLIINGTNIGEYILEATYGFYDTWSSDTGFNTLSGKFSGTFKGYVTDLQINFGRTTQAEMTQIKNTRNDTRIKYA